MRSCYVNEGFGVVSSDFVVFGEPAIAVQPCESALYDPAPGKDLEPIVDSFDDFNLGHPAQTKILHPFEERARIAAISPDLAQPAKLPRPLKKKLCSIAVLQTGGMHTDTKQQSHRVYQKMSFSSHDLLARIKAALSGLASHLNALAVDNRGRGGFFFPLLIRTRSRNASLSLCQTPPRCHLAK